MKGSMLHIWWNCPKIRRFWNKIFQIVSKVTGLLVPKSPTTALLNIHIPTITKYSQKRIFLICLGSKLSIAKAWKCPKVSIQAAKRKMSWIMSQEKLASSLLDSSEQFQETWDPWATYEGLHLPLVSPNIKFLQWCPGG